MKFDEKKQLIYECVRLGMDLYESTLLAECTDEEAKELNNDITFQKRVAYNELVKERDLLQMHDEAIRIAIDKGDAKGVQWRLERLRPERYSSTVFNNIKAEVRTETEHSFKDMPKEERDRVSEELLKVLKQDIDEEV